MTDRNGETTQVDLLEAGNVYGELSKCRTDSGDCVIRSVEVGGAGFEGTYGVPSSVENVVERRRLLGQKVSDELIGHIRSRRLQVENNPTKKIFNPVYCIREQDAFLFAI